MHSVSIENSLTLGTLNTNVVVGGAMHTASDNEFRALTIRGLWSLNNFTIGEGPIVFGVAHGDYTDAEIEAYLEEDASMARGDKIAAEVAQRLVRQIGIVSGEAADETINDGKPLYTRLNWKLATGQFLRAWAWNKGGANLQTGSILKFQGRLVLRWL